MAEIGEIDLSIDWAKQAVDFNTGHQSRAAADYWCTLLADHRPADVFDARAFTFRRWPTATTAAYLHAASGPDWPAFRDDIDARLAESPCDAVWFTFKNLKDVRRA